MSLYLTTLSLVPLFVSRAFLPLFVTAALARLGIAMSTPGVMEAVQWLNVVPADTLPPWATSNVGLFVLGALGAYELASPHIAELRNLGGMTETVLKAAGAAVLTIVLLNDPATASAASMQTAAIGSFAMLWAGGVGSGVWFFADMRRTAFEFLHDADPDDDLRLQRMLAWAEDGIGVVGVFLVFLVPTVTVALTGFALVAIYLTQRFVDHRVDADVFPCRNCAQPMQHAALACPSCRTVHLAPRELGFLGTARDQPVVDQVAHRHSLRKKRRCTHCASRLEARTADQHCTQCGTPVFSSAAERDRYLLQLDRALPATMLVCASFSLIPVVGLIPGIIYYRLTLVSAVRGYIPRGQSFVLRMVLRMAKLVLLCLQWVPVLGGLSMPVMCWVDYRVCRGAVQRQQITARPAHEAVVASGEQAPLLGQRVG